MSQADAVSTSGPGLPFRKKMRVLIDGGPIGAWVTIGAGSITVDPDTLGTYQAYRTGVIVQREPGLVIIRRTFLSAILRSQLLVIRGATPAGSNVTVGVDMTAVQWRLIAPTLTAAGFAVTTLNTKYSPATELGRLAQ